MLKLVRSLCLVVLAAATGAMELDLLMITQKSYEKTMDLSWTNVVNEYRRAQMYLNALNSEIQLEHPPKLASSSHEEKITSAECHEYVSARGWNSRIECTIDKQLDLDGNLESILTRLEAYKEKAKKCVSDVPDTTVIVSNMKAAGCIKRIELNLLRIANEAKSRFFTIVCHCKRSHVKPSK